MLIEKPVRRRCVAHLKWVCTLPCCIWDRWGETQAHHLMHSQPRARGLKVSDEFAVPLCQRHHTSLHMQGNEAGWWRTHEIDPMLIAADLWSESVTRKRVKE